MNGVLALVAVAAVSIDTGVQRLPEGGYEFIIQLEPAALDSLASGSEAHSQLPPHLRDVRSYRIKVGEGTLPQEWEPPTEPPAVAVGATASAEPAPPADTPTPIDPDPAGKELGPRMAGYEQPKEAGAADTPSDATPPAGNLNSADKSRDSLWPPLVGALLALFASLGANVFLAWNAAATRARYRSLVTQVQTT